MTSIFARISAALRPEPQVPPSPARARHQKSGHTIFTRLLGYVAGVRAAADGCGLQPADASLAGLQPGGALTRRAYAKGKISKLGEEASRFKEKQQGQDGHLHYWRVNFLYHKFGDLPRAELKSSTSGT